MGGGDKHVVSGILAADETFVRLHLKIDLRCVSSIKANERNCALNLAGKQDSPAETAAAIERPYDIA